MQQHHLWYHQSFRRSKLVNISNELDPIKYNSPLIKSPRSDHTVDSTTSDRHQSVCLYRNASHANCNVIDFLSSPVDIFPILELLESEIDLGL